MSGQSTGIYRAQRAYFSHAYETGRHGWPTVGVSPMVARFLRSVKGRGGRALDIGCGEGRHSAAFAQSGFLTVGVDLEPKALARARAALNGAADGPTFLQANVFALPFSAGTFDVVVDYGCLHHIRRPDTRRYLDQVVPLLKPGGYYLLSCFSTKFKHHAGERRTRDWLVHAGHYDRFFRRADFPAIFGRWFDLLELTEDRDGLYVFHNVLMRKRATSRGSRPGRGSA
ncbi:MAG: class I SAM-dependent methyltransferase [Nitrospirota bacterium]